MFLHDFPSSPSSSSSSSSRDRYGDPISPTGDEGGGGGLSRSRLGGSGSQDNNTTTTRRKGSRDKIEIRLKDQQPSGPSRGVSPATASAPKTADLLGDDFFVGGGGGGNGGANTTSAAAASDGFDDFNPRGHTAPAPAPANDPFFARKYTSSSGDPHIYGWTDIPSNQSIN